MASTTKGGKLSVRKTHDGRGMGLYATGWFKRGELIGRYGGDRLTMKELEDIYGKGRETTATYAVRVGKNTVIDDWKRTSLIAYANDPVDLNLMRELLDAGISRTRAYSMATDRRALNSSMRSYAGNVALYATRTIEPGEEILWNYGVNYWLP